MWNSDEREFSRLDSVTLSIWLGIWLFPLQASSEEMWLVWFLKIVVIEFIRFQSFRPLLVDLSSSGGRPIRNGTN